MNKKTKIPRRWVIGDIHGEYEKLLEVLKQANIDPENDTVIQIGDIVDRGSQPFECMHELLKFKKLVLIMGNHDDSFIAYTNTGKDPMGAYPQNGSSITIKEWEKLNIEEKAYLKENIFNKMQLYYKTLNNIIFVHGGLDPEQKLENTHDSVFVWDRELLMEAVRLFNEEGNKEMEIVEPYSKIFLGHTPTIYWDQTKPMILCNDQIINIDTGSGKGGPLTIMDIDTLEYFQSK